jgi:hypothetical protein
MAQDTISAHCTRVPRIAITAPTEPARHFGGQIPAAPPKSSPLSPNHRFVIALHFAGGVIETGLRVGPLEKKARSLAWGVQTGHSLRSGFRAKDTELRRFPAFPSAMQLNFSASQTAWRSAQSHANPSPLKFPANREKYREFTRF